MTRRLYDVDTPTLVVHESVALANIERFQRHCDEAGLKLRPHIKTHKSPIIAEMQIAAGAKGITCQKLGEAEVMADAGIEDIVIATNLLGSTIRQACLSTETGGAESLCRQSGVTRSLCPGGVSSREGHGCDDRMRYRAKTGWC